MGGEITIGDVTFLHKAAAVLEFAARKSKHSYQVRLCLVRIYRLLCKSPSLLTVPFYARPLTFFLYPYT